MINIIIFSKDRACQLELLLRSMKTFFFESSICNVSILYRYSNDLFKKGYDRTILLHPEYNYVLEENGGFKRQLISLIKTELKGTMFLVDDIIFKDYFFIRSNEMRKFLDTPDIVCLSLRMCPRISYCYPEKRATPPPEFLEGNVWNWVGLPGDWGYPHSLDAHLFRTDEILPLIRSMNYSNPNTFEGTWSTHPPINQPYMICYEESKIVNNPINKVQTANNNHCGNISAETLNVQYLMGLGISLNTFIKIKNMSPHQETILTFINLPIFTVNDLVNLVNVQGIDYGKVIRNSMHIERMESSDINFYIPVRGRLPFIEPCVEYLKKAIEQGPYKVKIVIIENSTLPEFFIKAENLGVDYIYIPSELSQSKGMFAKSLAYNIGYLLSKPAKWNIFHDLDILVQPDYFSKLKKYLDENPKWVQPYTKRRVLRISEEYTNKICLGDHVDLEKIPEGHVVASRPGSPGGSIVVRNDMFENVGGYDPELFYGYAPEDDLFWAKLEASSSITNTIRSCFDGGNGVFADAPSIEVYHMFHVCLESQNKEFKRMLFYDHSYYSYSHEDKLKYNKHKKDILKEAKKVHLL